MKSSGVNSRSRPEANVADDSLAVMHQSPKEVVAMTPLPFEMISPEGEGREGGESRDADIHSEVDDDNATVSTRTDDDIVNMAMTAVLPLDDDDDEMEQVVYPKQNILLSTV